VYVGVDTLNGELEADILWKIYGKPSRIPMNLMVDWRDGFWVAANFTDNDQTVPALRGAKMLVGSAVIPPGGVAIWQ
jgi:beta-galactosidase